MDHYLGQVSAEGQALWEEQAWGPEQA